MKVGAAVRRSVVDGRVSRILLVPINMASFLSVSKRMFARLVQYIGGSME